MPILTDDLTLLARSLAVLRVVRNEGTFGSRAIDATRTVRGLEIDQLLDEARTSVWHGASALDLYAKLTDNYDLLNQFKPPRSDDLPRAIEWLREEFRSGRLVALRQEDAALVGAEPAASNNDEPDDSALDDVDTTGSSTPEPAASPSANEEPTWFEVIVVDEQARAMDGVDVELSVDGKIRKLATDGAGRVRVDDARGSFGSLRFSNVAKVREKLRARSIPPSDAPLPSGENTHVVRVRDDMASVPLEATRPLTLVLQREHPRIMLVGMFFETDKSFLLPSAMHGIRGVVKVYQRNPSGKLLAVGHTDTAGDENWNLDLSLERADAVADYLTDNAEGWLKWFEAKVHFKKAWGVREEQHMLSALPVGSKLFYDGPIDGLNGPLLKAAVARFQEWSNATRGSALVIDGNIGSATRRQLVEEYMAIDETSLPIGVELTRHGCGEFFPEDETADGVADAENRRVEIFCFDGKIDPAPPGKVSRRGSTAYRQWRKQITETIDFTTDLDDVFIRVLDRKHQPMVGVPFRITWSALGTSSGTSGDDGICSAAVPASVKTFVVEWGESIDGSSLPFRRQACRVTDDSDGDIVRRLDNLGFGDRGGDPQASVRDYQRRRGSMETGRCDDVRVEVVDWHDRGLDKPVTQD